MTDPSAAQFRDMAGLMSRTHSWIDSLQIAGIEERVILAAMHVALIERSRKSQ